MQIFYTLWEFRMAWSCGDPAVEKTEWLLNNLTIELRALGDGLRGEGLREIGVEGLFQVFSSNNWLGWRLDRWGDGEEVWACLLVFRTIEGFSARGPWTTEGDMTSSASLPGQSGLELCIQELRLADAFKMLKMRTARKTGGEKDKDWNSAEQARKGGMPRRWLKRGQRQEQESKESGDKCVDENPYLGCFWADLVGENRIAVKDPAFAWCLLIVLHGYSWFIFGRTLYLPRFANDETEQRNRWNGSGSHSWEGVEPGPTPASHRLWH